MPVTHIEVLDRGLLAGGVAFGDIGSYEYLAGTLHFATDPEHPTNAVISDLSLAPRRADGLVEYRSQFHLLKPATPPSRGRLIADVVNRGNMTALGMFNASPRRTNGDPNVDPGNGFLMREGYSLLSVGIQWDPPDSPERLRAWFPEAMEGGERLTGTSHIQWWPNRAVTTQQLSDAGHHPYRTADIDDPDAVLTVREHHDAPPEIIPRHSWRFARLEDGAVTPDTGYVTLDGDFQPGKVYELTYRTTGAPIIGLGFLAYRDAASFLRHEDADAGNPLAGALSHAYGWGQSMSGRWLREYLYWGLNRDEAGRQVFDGMFCHLGSSRRGEFNLRFGQPSTNILRAPGNTYPFAFDATPDPVAGANEGLLDRSRANASMPKLFHVNSAMEYWWSGASLAHTTVDGERDIDLPEDVREYHLSGTQHTPGSLPLRMTTPDGFQAQQPLNTLDYRPVMRALLVALDRWVRAGELPPPSHLPRIADGTAVTRESLQEAHVTIPGAAWVRPLPQRRRLDFGPDFDSDPRHRVASYPPREGEAYPVLVSSLDDDGNEIAGIRLPEITVPLATYTGWNVRHEAMGGAGLMTSGSPLFGSTLPFPATRAERIARGDPRLAIEERYASRDDYLSLVRGAALALVEDHLLLEEDVEVCVRAAAQTWDEFTHGSSE